MALGKDRGPIRAMEASVLGMHDKAAARDSRDRADS